MRITPTISAAATLDRQKTESALTALTGEFQALTTEIRAAVRRDRWRAVRALLYVAWTVGLLVYCAQPLARLGYVLVSLLL